VRIVRCKQWNIGGELSIQTRKQELEAISSYRDIQARISRYTQRSRSEEISFQVRKKGAGTISPSKETGVRSFLSK
jgi:predicted nuclease of restriction endonuclease-like RecB superfamily